MCLFSTFVAQQIVRGQLKFSYNFTSYFKLITVLDVSILVQRNFLILIQKRFLQQ